MDVKSLFLNQKKCLSESSGKKGKSEREKETFRP